jgi:hypothetical protein
MAGDSNVGGGGSVQWSVDADKVDKYLTSDEHTGPSGRGRHKQQGHDQDGTEGQDSFRVTVRNDGGQPPVWQRKSDGVWFFDVVILPDPKQIIVHWGGVVGG